MSLSVLIVIVVVLALAFDFVNGWHDAANAIATVVATRVLSPMTAVLLAAALNLTGAFVGTEVANTVAKIVHTDASHVLTAVGDAEDAKQQELRRKHVVMLIVVSGCLSASIWGVFTCLAGLPVSGSHSLIGGIMGAGVAAAGVQILVGATVTKTLAAMLLAPLMGFTTAYFAYVLLIWVTRRFRPSSMNKTFGRLQVLSASAMAFAHGMNDAQKVMGVITMALLAGGFQEPSADPKKFEILLWVKMACATAIGVGTAAGGWRVIKTLGHYLTRLGTPEGFAAETSASIVLNLAAYLGVPTSSTHTITGCILGVGATRGISSVKWGLGEKIILAWVFTLPICAAMSGTIFGLLQLWL